MTLNKDHIGALWDTITPRLYGYLVNTLHDKNLAEDILQTTWLKAIEALPKFDNRNDTSFSSWLFAIARNECKQHWRKPKREIPFDPVIHDKEEINSKEEDKIFIDQMLAQLSLSDQELINLHYIAGLPLNNIAKILKTNPVTIRVRMHRALGAAKLILKNQQI
ncbi:MAG: RNA polymerase sigma factor [Candidatus Paceibacterota bacterium]|jgi:RNA polymerase sigma-70 factor (ECF subfamily)